MKITKRQLRRIIEEQVDQFSARKGATAAIADAVIGYMEANPEEFFDKGRIPQSVLQVIENASGKALDGLLETVDAAKAAD